MRKILLKMIGRHHFRSTVASSGTGSHHPGTPGGGAVFPGTIQGSIGDFSGTGLVFPWATNARGKPRRGMMRRAVFSDLQRRGLEKRFQLQKYISKPDRKKLAEKLGLKDSQVSDHIIIFCVTLELYSEYFYALVYGDMLSSCQIQFEQFE